MIDVPQHGLGDWLRLSASNYPDRPCLVTDEASYSFAEINDRVDRLAHALSERGIRQGDRVAIFATDSFRYVETLFASLKIGSTYVPLNFRLAEPELRLLLTTASPACLIISARYAHVVANVLDDVPSIRFVISYDDGDGLDASFERYEEVLASSEPIAPTARPAESDIAGLCFTSGTTGLPKGVLHSHRTVKWYALHGMIERRFHATSFHYSPAPIFHVAGMVFPMASIARGSTSLVLGEFDPAVVLRWMRGGQLNSCFLVPTMISTLLQHPDLELGDYAAIESIAYGAAPMTVTLLRRAIDAFHCEFMHMFGAGTEAGLQALLTPEDHRRALDGHEHLLGSIGKPAFGVELRIVDSEMNDVPVGTVGEIATRAEAIMAGYLDQPELTAKTVVDGWFRGGDLARMDEDGYLYLSGRSTDMIIRGGENIYPMEIESVLAEFPDVVEYAVVGAPDEHWGEIVRAHLVVRDAQTFDVDALTAFCRGRLAGYKVPAEFVLEDALPKNASGKVLKRDLRGANA